MTGDFEFFSWPHHFQSSETPDRSNKNWEEFSNNERIEILKTKTKEFVLECKTNNKLWRSLTNEQKLTLFNELESMENQYITDYFLLLLWRTELNFSESRYLQFSTNIFRYLQQDILKDTEKDRASDEYTEWIFQQINKWSIPTLSFKLESSMLYTPSQKLQDLRQIAIDGGDKESLCILDSIVININDKFGFK